ncbi:hypothetical protein CWR43_32400 [Rhizobium sullae]|uniref:Response regulatory domain-containing protein n=1 Tax=Rhizobium sullae TaxID=50338 RepID=A0A2N0D041_RHISU|nr:response regulator [Rhizobium sullae]PKA39480.1 hypothetical protein CWR43_32400 [Rhizobium sullae]
MTHGPTIGLIDDDVNIRVALDSLLRAVGYQTAVFSSASEFLECGRENVQCIILDIRMPGISGLELQSRLASEGCGMPVIFMTGHLNDRIKERAIRNGARCVLSKPVEQGDILRCIAHALGKEGNIAPDA